ncbi:TRAP transporter small permease [Terasakiella sp. SH-1]|uniref:TRAP transporter small permease n=1 Tax=Terasakiella sp. SH-1 TaxID=2560057 RepID=UPI001073A60B|nr:TRAP transporter small permease [Terasakiella sp. SH-1]
MSSQHNHTSGPGEGDAPFPELEIEEKEVDVSDFSWVDTPGLIFFWILMVVVFLQFFTRYVLNDSLGWTEEVARFLLILVAFCGAITGARKGTHIFLEFFYRFVPTPVAKALSILAELINVTFFGYMAYVGYQLAEVTRQNMISIPVPKAMIYWAVAISFAIMAVYSVIWLVHKIRSDSKTIVAEIEEHALNE